MACAFPFRVIDKSTNEIIGLAPCGRCCNCLVDTRNAYDDLCNEELYQRNFAASYLTVTYDDYHIDWRDNWHGSLTASLRKSDAAKFIKKIRSYMKYHNIDNPLAQKDFRYIVCGEYGEDNKALPRPHLHFVFFGLDYRFCADMFRKCWTFGNQKLLPVKSGCFRYVLNYMQKQVKSLGSNVRDEYECKNRERPFFHHSVGLGKTLFLRQWKDIVDNDYTYLSRKGVRRPLPVYYMHRYGLIRANSTLKERIQQWKNHKGNKPFNLSAYNKFKHEVALNRNEMLARKLRDTGIPVPVDVTSIKNEKTEKYMRELNRAVTDFFKQEKVTNDFVVDTLDIYPDIKAIFTDKHGKFVSSPLFPLYKNHRQIAYDLVKYGSLVPF